MRASIPIMKTMGTHRFAGAVICAAIGSLVAAGIAYRLTLPPTSLVLEADCSVRGISHLSADIYPAKFWAIQLKALQGERDKLLAQPAALASAEAMMQKLDADTDEITAKLYREHPEISPTRAESVAAALRKRADDLDRQDAYALMNEAGRRRINWLNGCEPAVRSHIE